MRLTVPIYVRPRPRPVLGTLYEMQPLFLPGPFVSDRLMSHALQELRKRLTAQACDLMGAGDAEGLAALAYCPAVREHRCNVPLVLRRHTARCAPTVVELNALDRRLAFLPDLPDLWFEVPPGTRLATRTAEVLEHYWRQREKDDEPGFEGELRAFAESPRGSVTMLDLELPQLPARRRRGARPGFALFGGEAEVLHGYKELQRTGQCLDTLYPDELEHATAREREVAELVRCLAHAERRPVALVGKPQVGKTTIVHQAVRQRVEQRQRRREKGYKKNIWALAPARIISGMSFVGQWENRLLAIIKETVRRDHVLYFDDVIGLYCAGVSASADLTVAQVLKPYVERRALRLLLEVTPEAWRRFQELDRGFADLFHVIRVDELPDEQVYRVLIAAARRLEDQHDCRFAPAAIATVCDLQRHYNREAAFPGKAAVFMRALAVKGAGEEVGRSTILEQFRQKSGLMTSVLDADQKLPRAEVVEQLRQRLVGQEPAIEAMADVVCLAKARLADPHRPLATLLFLGPTGVGKTQAAKALAGYLFGEAERLLRFDMNECLEADAAGRLIGTLAQPEGLLTSAIRRQPFAVVLLDEIEKAHPVVFDLLLQVLGEGRLTDALGRTADFTNAVIILTSNLGVRQAASRFGFAGQADAEAQRATVYLEAARDFFRPEFYNRLDRVIPFRNLSRPEIRELALRLIHDVFAREGLRQRRTLLDVHPAAMERIVDQGYHPDLGARALKRVIEQKLTQPVAAELAGAVPEAPVVVNVFLRGAEVATHATALTIAQGTPPPIEALDLDQPQEILDAAECAMRRIQARIAVYRPAGPIVAGRLSPKEAAYLALTDALARTRNELRELLQRLIRPRSHRFVGGVGSRGLRQKDALGTDYWHSAALQRALLTALDLVAYMRELGQQAGRADPKPRYRLVEALQRLALLDLLAQAIDSPDGWDAVLLFRLVGGSSAAAEQWLQQLGEVVVQSLGTVPGLSTQPLAAPPTVRAWALEGPACTHLTALERGTWLLAPAQQQLLAVQVEVLPLRQAQQPDETLQTFLQRREDWLRQLAAGRAAPQDDPWPLQPLTRVFSDLTMVDFHTGLVTSSRGWSPLALLLPRLPLPAEFTE